MIVLINISSGGIFHFPHILSHQSLVQVQILTSSCSPLKLKEQDEVEEPQTSSTRQLVVIKKWFIPFKQLNNIYTNIGYETNRLSLIDLKPYLSIQYYLSLQSVYLNHSS